MNELFSPLWHYVFESAAYMIGFRLYSARRARVDGDPQSITTLVLAVGAIFGAVFGAKFVFWLQEPELVGALVADPRALIGGKTVVGGFIGGRLGVELAKKVMGVTTSTGDAFVTPMTIGLVLGRIGCFLSGLHDGTHGIVTSLPWGFDYGDGVLRHPTQLYEVLAVAGLWGVIQVIRPYLRRDGDRFRLWLAGYLVFRLCVEALKPQPYLHAGLLTGIQAACLITLLFDLPHLLRIGRDLVRRGHTAAGVAGVAK